MQRLTIPVTIAIADAVAYSELSLGDGIMGV
jgi:hypothetical protein